METYALEIILGHLQYIVTVGEEDITSLDILGHILVFAFLEVLELSRVIALNPACLVEVYRLPTALGIILVLETVLYDLKLQLTHRTDELTAVMLVHEELCHTLAHKLVDTLGKLLGLHRVGILDIFEHLGREARKSLEMEHFSLGKRIAYLEVACIRQTDDITRIGLFNGALALCHELSRRREAQVLAQTYVTVRGIAHELS